MSNSKVVPWSRTCAVGQPRAPAQFMAAEGGRNQWKRPFISGEELSSVGVFLL